LILIPYLSADNTCYVFQIPEYSKYFTCISIDPRGAGETDRPEGVYSTELFADDIAAFMQVLGIEKAHVAGVSLGTATGMWLGAKYPDKVKSLSLHNCSHAGLYEKTEEFNQKTLEFLKRHSG
jgi:3-oxoadipate enol-lactonase